jgi:O-antigen/teichoic acid export membrane protein
MIRRNIVANMTARAWGVISVYLFVPLYLKFLGIEAYGLVGFYSTLLGVLAFADMGFTATLNREMARLAVFKDSGGEMRDLLRTYESTYCCISSLLAVTICALATLISEHWLRSKVLHPREMAGAIRIMGVAIAFQLPSGLYIGGLMGLQRQVRANSIQIAWGVFRGLGAVLVLWLLSPTILGFALWQLLSNAIYCFAARLGLWRALPAGPNQRRPHFEWRVFHETWRYAAGMAGIAIVATLLTQTDKLVVSKLLPLEMLGYYTLATALATAPLTLAGPIASAVYPRLTGFVASEDSKGLILLYQRTSELVAVAAVPVGLTVALFAGGCIYAWTGSTLIAHRAAPAASLLVGGQMMQALTVVPFYLALAHGNVRLNLQIGIASVVLVTPLLVVLIMKYGVMGGGLSWLIMNCCTLPPYLYFLHRRFLPGQFRRWCGLALGRPLLAAAPCVLLGYWLKPVTSSRLMTLCVIALVWAVATAVTAAASSEARRRLFLRVYPKANTV